MPGACKLEEGRCIPVFCTGGPPAELAGAWAELSIMKSEVSCVNQLISLL